MSEIDLNDLTVSIEKGGMREFAETNVYPSYIKFYSAKSKKSWKQSIKNENQSGSVKANGKVIFKYELMDYSCRVKFIKNNILDDDWIYPETTIMMID
jgi:hypothetical protein